MEPGTLVEGRFEVERLAGSGGMAAVYRARDRESGERVAVKVLTSSIDDPDRFAREARILSSLDHPNVVKFIAFGETAARRAYLVLEWLEGEDLAERLQREPPSRADALRLARVLARALAAAHARGIVHRDIKPGNVLLVDGRVERAKLLDFGIARAIDSTRALTRSGTTLGTPSYMAPEQARGDVQIEAQADVFSLACVLFECLTGQPPFSGSHVMAILAKVLFEEAPRVSELWPGVPPSLDALIARALSKDPANRPRNGEEFARALDAIDAREMEAAVTRAASPEVPREISGLEQRLLAVVVVDAPARGPSSAEADTLHVASGRDMAAASQVVSGFGGRISPLADGSLVAVFTSSTSATDLALSAARCALSLAKVLRGRAQAIAMGRGIASGRMPVGGVIDRAVAMMRQRAREDDEPVAIVVDDLLTGLLDARFAVRGDARSLILVGEQDLPVDVRRLIGKPTPCVGRSRELAALESTLAEVAQDHVGRGVLITADAGMGKSRVRHEFLRRVHAGDVPCDVWLGRADPLFAGAPFAVISSALRRAFRLADDEPIEARRRKLRARVGRYVDAQRADRVAEFLGEMIGVPFPGDASVQLTAAREDPALMSDQIRRAFEELVDAETQAKPLLIVLEDLHWGDAPTVRLIDGVMRTCRERPLMVLAAGRPETTALFPSLGPAGGFTHVVLGELSRRAQQQLIENVLGADFDATRRDDLVARAGGNAFFLEELVRHVAAGEASLLPDTVLAMLDARLAALPAEERRVLRAASIFGTVFWERGLEPLLGSAVRTGALQASISALLAAEMIQRRSSSRFAGEVEMVFRHAMLRDAAYASLTERDQSAGHLLAASWLESVGERDAVVLGEHYQRAGHAERAAGCLTAAAEQALEGDDAAGALKLLARARGLGGPASAEQRGEIALLAAEAHRWRGETAEAEARAIEAYALLRPGSKQWFRASAEAINACTRRGEYDLAFQQAEQVSATAHDADADGARILALCAAGRALFHAGGYEHADELIERVNREAGAHEDPRVLAEVHRLLGARARHVGDLAGDLRHYQRALSAYEAAGDARNACNARVSVGFSWIEVGELTRARQELETALRDAERMRLSTIVTRARQNLGLVLAAEGRLAEAREVETAVAEESREQKNVRFEGWTRIYLARILHTLGDLTGAEREARRAATLLEVTPPARAGALAALALVKLSLGDVPSAAPYANEAFSTLEAFGGIEEFESLVWFAAISSSAAAGNVDAARALSRQALEKLTERARAIEDGELRRSFLQRVPDNRALVDLSTDLDVGSDARRRVRDAYALRSFSDDARLLVDKLAVHLERSMSGAGRVGPGMVEPKQMLTRFDGDFPEEAQATLGPLVDAVLSSSNHQHHPRYMGYQVSTPLPRAALLSLLSATVNAGMAAFDSGPAATALERRVIDWMLGQIGWTDGGGVLTSGGSLGNLTALLAARQARAGFDAREEGLAGQPPLVLLCAEESHYSIERAAQIMGLGRRSVVRLPTDARFRLDPRAVAPAVRDARARGAVPFALVASAGSTGTGAIDPLGAIADACAEFGLWMHVDGAHGASALLSQVHRDALRGIERADSLVWDAHKLMAMPALATAVLTKAADAGYAAFAQSAAYLYPDGDLYHRWFDVGLRTVECTKGLISVPLYLTLSSLGTRLFGDIVDHGYTLARALARGLQEADDFELLVEPESNIVCFRHLGSPRADASELDELQRGIRARLVENGRFFIVLTTTRGGVWLRACLMNPLTQPGDLAALLEEVRVVARALGQK